MQILGYMNVYRSGHFHRVGKPGMFDRHAGDLYPTHESALADIEPASHYIDTVPVVWNEPTMPAVNGAQSIPTPLSVTRVRHQELQAIRGGRVVVQEVAHA